MKVKTVRQQAVEQLRDAKLILLTQSASLTLHRLEPRIAARLLLLHDEVDELIIELENYSTN